MNSPPPAPKVPDTCQLPPIIRFAMLLPGGNPVDAADPCARCNHDRTECGGRPRKDG